MGQISDVPRIHMQIAITWWQKRWNYSRKLQNAYMPITTSKGEPRPELELKPTERKVRLSLSWAGTLLEFRVKEPTALVMAPWEEARADEASYSRGREPVLFSATDWVV